MKIALPLVLIILLLLRCSPPRDVDTYLSELHQNGELNGSVLLVRNDTVLYQRAFGYADGTRTQPLTPEYRFAIGSIYKEFPAVAIMQLREEGKLSLEDTLSDLLPHLPDWAQKITIRNLLQYSSGLPQVDWDTHFQEGAPRLEEVLQDLTHQKELAFEPGTDYIYSNYNPFLLMEIVARLTDLDYESYVEQMILEPYDLDGIVVKDQFPYQDPHQMAIPFDEEFQEDAIEHELPEICASTTGMYQWFSKLDGFEIVSRESVRQLSETAKEGDNIQSPLGRCDWENQDIKLHVHHGSSGNYECLVRHHKPDGLMIVLLTNQKHGNLHEIADTLYDIARQRSQ